MIKSAVVAMVVIGCDCDGKVCEFIRETPAQWATVSECEAALLHQTLSPGSYEYPLVTGLCRDVVAKSSEVASASPKLENENAATVEPAVYSAALAGTGRSVLQRTADGYLVVRERLGRAAASTASVARRTGGRLIERLTESF